MSPFETSADGRTLPQVGAKFLRKKGQKIKSLRPLGKQLVDQQDSVLGSDSRSPRPGLKIASYDQLIRKAFKKEWWKSKLIIQVDSNGTPTILAKNDENNESEEGQTLPANQFSLRDWNFSLFSGLAMQKYMSTLVSDKTPFDKFQAGNINALTEQEKSGLTVFVNNPANGGGNCNTCHTIPEFTRASVRRTAGVASTDSIDALITGV